MASPNAFEINSQPIIDQAEELTLAVIEALAKLAVGEL